MTFIQTTRKVGYQMQGAYVDKIEFAWKLVLEHHSIPWDHVQGSQHYHQSIQEAGFAACKWPLHSAAAIYCFSIVGIGDLEAQRAW